MVLAPISNAAAFQSVFSVSRETIGKLETYEALLRKWQKTINLVAPSTLNDIWRRHFADSAQLAGLADQVLPAPVTASNAGTDGPMIGSASAAASPPYQGESDVCGSAADWLAAVGTQLSASPISWLDLGSGAGFPGMVVAILLSERRPGSRVTLVESDQRKSAFLREVARLTGTSVDILSIRIESAATQFKLPLPDVVSARALAPLDKLLGLSVPFLTPSTVCLFPKGREAEREVEDARRDWRFKAELQPSLTDGAARIVVMRNVEANAED